MAASTAPSSFKCRKCRHLLFTSDDLLQSHIQMLECSSWYLKDEDILPWVQTLVDESGWTEGKLYCPKCNGRVGGFDFLHVVQCSCMVDLIPAIWCPKSRVDADAKFDLRSTKEQSVKPENDNMGTQCAVPNADDSSSKMDGASDVTSSNTNTGSHADNVVSSMFAAPVIRCKDDTSLNGRHKLKELTTESVGKSFLRCERVMYDSKDSVLLHKPAQHKCYEAHQSSVPNAEAINSSLENSPCKTCSEPYVTVGHIQEGLKEIKMEVEKLYPVSYHNRSNLGHELIGRRKRKPRRRGRGNWEHGEDYIRSIKETWKYDQGIDFIKQEKILEDETEREVELSESEIPDFYKCSVCLSLLHEPLETPCHHVFCSLCLRQLNHVSRGRPKCPLCREPIRNVQSVEDLETEIQISFPANYRKRVKETRKNRHRRSALPSPRSTRFESESADEDREQNSRLIHRVTIIALAISLLINGILVNVPGNHIGRVNFHRNVALFLIIAIGCMCASLLILCLVLFALDFVKIALLLVLTYVAMTKLILRELMD